jgi:di/tricarboxylate transporter
MDWQGWLTLGLTAGTLLTLVFTRLSTDFVMMGTLVILATLGILTPDEAIAGFSNSGLLTVAAMFVIAAGISNSGGVDMIVRHVLGTPITRQGALLRLSAPVILLSSVLNNTPVVATMIPAVARWSKQIKQSPSLLMMPLSYASILGGTLTLIGTSTNLVVNGQYQKLTGKEGFGLFDITLVGLPVAIGGLLAMVFLFPRLLPSRKAPDELLSNKKEYTFEVAVANNGPLVGKSVAEAGLRNLNTIYLVEIERDGHIVTAVPSEERLQSGDRLVFVGDTHSIIDILRINGLVASDSTDPVIERDAPERRIIEAIVSPHCDSIGLSIRDSEFRARYGAVVLAVARNGEHVKGNLGSIILSEGDLLLLEARPAFVSRQRHVKDFLMVNDLEENRPNHARSLVSWAILAMIVLSATTGLTSMLVASFIGAGLMVATGCLTMPDARKSIDLSVVMTIAASFTLGTALTKTGAAEFLANGILGHAGTNPLLLLLLLYISVSVLTEIISNNAAAMMMLPIVLAITSKLGLNDVPYVMTLMMAASASFATPLGYQCNLMVQGPGGYRFTDYFKPGIFMNMLCCIITVSVVPWIWPLV